MARGNLTEKVTPEASEHAGAYLRKEHFRRGTNARAQNTTKLVLFQISQDAGAGGMKRVWGVLSH